jgi:hypothetical protein
VLGGGLQLVGQQFLAVGELLHLVRQIDGALLLSASRRRLPASSERALRASSRGGSSAAPRTYSAAT